MMGDVQARRASAQVYFSRSGADRLGMIHSWVPKESKIQSDTYQNNSDVDEQSLPELMPEEGNVQSDDQSYHRQDIK